MRVCSRFLESVFYSETTFCYLCVRMCVCVCVCGALLGSVF